MTQPLQPEPFDAPDTIAALHVALDGTLAALSTFDADGLERLEAEVRALTTGNLARALDQRCDAMPELLRKHTLLSEMLNATAANLRVVAAVVEAKRVATHDRSNLVLWPR